MSKFKILLREHSCQVPHYGGPKRDLLHRAFLVGGYQYQLQEKSQYIAFSVVAQVYGTLGCQRRVHVQYSTLCKKLEINLLKIIALVALANFRQQFLLYFVKAWYKFYACLKVDNHQLIMHVQTAPQSITIYEITINTRCH